MSGLGGGLPEYRGDLRRAPSPKDTLLRVHMTMAADNSAAAAWATLAAIEKLPDHEFWDGAFSYTSEPHRFLQGRKQVTDAWPAELGRRRKAKLATLDESLAVLHSDVAVLIAVQT